MQLRRENVREDFRGGEKCAQLCGRIGRRFRKGKCSEIFREGMAAFYQL